VQIRLVGQGGDVGDGLAAISEHHRKRGTFASYRPPTRRGS
jgi:hypothetical protein